nr:DUF2721 domain-containing protein [Ochrobactrum vermis]
MLLFASMLVFDAAALRSQKISAAHWGVRGTWELQTQRFPSFSLSAVREAMPDQGPIVTPGAVDYFGRVKVYLRVLMNTPPVITDFASVIQTSLAPVFLLAGTAGFVNIYTTRLGRVSDRLNEVSDRFEQSETSRMQLAYLRRRTLALEIAVALGVIAGVCTGAATLNLLAGALSIGLRQENLFWFFGGAIVSLILSLVAFLYELLLAGRNMLRQIRTDRAGE